MSNAKRMIQSMSATSWICASKRSKMKRAMRNPHIAVSCFFSGF